MISVNEALDLVLGTVKLAAIESIPLGEAVGRILAEDIFSDRPMPPFDRVAMDGIAIDYAAYDRGRKIFEIEGIGPAGSPQVILKDAAKCIEIMTGAPLPLGTNTVIRYEDVLQKGQSFELQIDVQPNKNIHYQGSDHDKDIVLLRAGMKIKAIDINVLATVGKEQLLVYRMPKIAVISSGDELVEVGEIPKPYQIRRSNVYMLQARLRELGVAADTYHFKDDSEAIYEEIQRILLDYDVLLMSGGVSKGKFDFIPEVLNRLGVEKLFHRVAQRPGKPFWFGTKGDKTVFAFPGNPVSTLACFHKYFIPYLYKSIACSAPQKLKVRLANRVEFKAHLTYFAQASIQQNEEGIFEATMQKGNGSGDMVNPTRMDGFLELPAEKEVYEAGELYDFMPFH